MSTIQLTRLTNTAAARHSVKVSLPLADGEETIEVIYRGMSLREFNEQEERFANADDDHPVLAKLVAENVVALPDVIDGDKPVEPTVEFFETLDVFVVHRILKAIREDRTANPTI